jgi:hypothetical protein
MTCKRCAKRLIQPNGVTCGDSLCQQAEYLQSRLKTVRRKRERSELQKRLVVVERLLADDGSLMMAKQYRLRRALTKAEWDAAILALDWFLDFGGDAGEGAEGEERKAMLSAKEALIDAKGSG